MALLDGLNFSAPRLDLSNGSRAVWDVRKLSNVSVACVQNLLSPNAWAKTVTLYWSDSLNDTPQALGSSALTTGAPGITGLDVSSIGYLWFYPATPSATQELVDLIGFGTATL